MSDTWHADRADIARYVAGTVDEVRAASIEAHLVACADCRAETAGVMGVMGATGAGRLDQAWAGIVDTLDRPRSGVLERVLRRVGVREHTARLLAATPSLRGSWLTAVVLALAFAVLAADQGVAGGQAIFLIVAPLLPVAGVAAAFGPALDPAWEMTAAAPMVGFRLLLLRAVAVFGASLGLAGAASLAVPGLAGSAVVWVLPALALTLACLALSTYMSPERAGSAVAVAWAAVIVTAAQGTHDLLAAFGPTSQLGLAVLAVAASVLVARRRDSFEIRSHL